MEKDIKDQIDDMDRKIRHCDNEIQKMRDGGSSHRDFNNNWNYGKNDYQHEPSFRPRGRGHMGGGMRGGGGMRMNPGPGGRNP